MNRGGLVLAVAAVAATIAVPAPASATLRFRDCEEEAECARLAVPLDRSGTVPGTLSLRVRRYRGEENPGRGVVLLLDGIPGESSLRAAPFPLNTALDDLVQFDQRGTGAGALRCRDLEAAAATDAGREAEACAALLGERRGLYSTDATVEDIEALRMGLGADRLTLVGVSYGTYVAQRYALSHPDRVERLVLYDAVDASGADPLMLDSMAAARRVLPALCRFGCDSFTSEPVDDTTRLVRQLASEPLRGTVFGPTGRGRRTALTRQELFFTLLAGDSDVLSRAEYPAAVVSALRGDPAPLLRVKRRTVSAARTRDPRSFSPATFAAVVCEEARFPWSWHATPAERNEATFAAESALTPSLVAPFDPGTAARSRLMRLCRRWPTASQSPPPRPGPMPDVPVLALSDPAHLGTPLETTRRAVARFARGRVLTVAGNRNPVLPWFDRCSFRAVGRFLQGRSVPARCPRARPLVAPTEPLPASLAELAPARGIPGARGRVVAAVGATFGDVFDELVVVLLADLAGAEQGLSVRFGGLRGGSALVGERAFRMNRFEFVPGVRLSARASRDLDVILLAIDGPGRLDGRMRVREPSDGLRLRLRGRLAGRRVRATVPIGSRFVRAFDRFEGSAAASTVSPGPVRLPGLPLR